MNQIGQLLEADGRFEFRLDAKALIVRGDHPEWVMQAAAEILAKTESLEAESKIDELATLVEFEAATEIEVESAKFAKAQRFEAIPQCIVSMGRLDYKWASPEGRRADEYDGHPYRRIHDMSLTFGDSFLKDEDGVSYEGQNAPPETGSDT
jgi:hypothetical protein